VTLETLNSQISTLTLLMKKLDDRLTLRIDDVVSRVGQVEKRYAHYGF
jgi:hypothetical protein